MALIWKGMPCSLCGETLDTSGPFFATTAFLGPNHPLFPYSDTAMHWECYERWPHRSEFASACFQSEIESTSANPYWGLALVSESVYVSLNPDPSVDVVSIGLRRSGSEIRVQLGQWSHWLAATPENVGDRLTRDALAEVLPVLRDAVPTREALLGAVDWEAKLRVFEERKERTRRDEEERLRKPKAHNKACRALLRSRIRCPHCAAFSTLRLSDGGPQEKSFFVCDACGEASGPIDVTLDELYARRPGP